jgi:hypothetical protein
MHTTMMLWTQGYEIVHVGCAIITPITNVVRLALGIGDIAMLNGTCWVHDFKRLALVASGKARGATDVEYDTL